VGGSLFRFTTGGLPFLLPLLLQVAFGMTAFKSGTLAIALAFGILTSRALVQQILRAMGFRSALIANSILCGLAPLACALLTQSTPDIVIVLLLVITGFSQGFQFTTLNTMAYSEIPPHRLSAATSFVQLFQQLSQGFGVAIAATLLHAS